MTPPLTPDPADGRRRRATLSMNLHTADGGGGGRGTPPLIPPDPTAEEGV